MSWRYILGGKTVTCKFTVAFIMIYFNVKCWIKFRVTFTKILLYFCRVTVGKTVTSPLSLFKVVYCKRKVRCYTPKPCYKKKQFPKSRGCDMANKENELACAGNLPAKLHDSRTHLLNSSDSGSSQTEGPSSKYSGFFSEVSWVSGSFCLVSCGRFWID